MARGLANPRRGVENTLWFNLLGLGNVIASVVIEHDELLDTFVGTMQIHGPLELQRFSAGDGTVSETLTEANVQRLEQPRIHRPLTTTVRSLRSSHSRSTERSRSRPGTQVRPAPSPRSHGSPRFSRRTAHPAVRCHPKSARVAALLWHGIKNYLRFIVESQPYKQYQQPCLWQCSNMSLHVAICWWLLQLSAVSCNVLKHVVIAPGIRAISTCARWVAWLVPPQPLPRPGDSLRLSRSWRWRWAEKGIQTSQPAVSPGQTWRLGSESTCPRSSCIFSNWI